MALETRRDPGAAASPNTSAGAPAARLLHPAIYGLMAGFALLFVIGAWTGFFADPETKYLLAIITGFIFAAVALPLLLWHVRRGGLDGGRGGAFSPRSLRDWLDADFDIWHERIKGWDAALAILLPIAAVSILMVVLSIIVNVEIG